MGQIVTGFGLELDAIKELLSDAYDELQAFEIQCYADEGWTDEVFEEL